MGEPDPVSAAMIAFLRMRLDAAGSAAEAAQLRFPGPWDQAIAPDSPLPSAVSLYDSRDESVGVIRGSYAAAHIVLNDPARVLRDIEAKRAVIARYERAAALPASVASFTCGQDDGYAQACLDAIRDAAAVWAGHPDYRQEWKPDG